MQPSFYVLLTINDVEPELRGYITADSRDTAAQGFKRTTGDQHGIFSLDIDAQGIPSVSSYSAGFLAKWVCRSPDCWGKGDPERCSIDPNDRTCPHCGAQLVAESRVIDQQTALPLYRN